MSGIGLFFVLFNQPADRIRSTVYSLACWKSRGANLQIAAPRVIQYPFGCVTMSIFGPLQEFSLILVASGALMLMCTLVSAATRGYSDPQTFVSERLIVCSDNYLRQVDCNLHSRVPSPPDRRRLLSTAIFFSRLGAMPVEPRSTSSVLIVPISCEVRLG